MVDAAFHLGVGETEEVHLHKEGSILEATFTCKKVDWVEVAIVLRLQMPEEIISLGAAARFLEGVLREGEDLDGLLQSLGEGQTVPVEAGVLALNDGNFVYTRTRVEEHNIRVAYGRSIRYREWEFEILPPGAVLSGQESGVKETKSLMDMSWGEMLNASRKPLNEPQYGD